MCIYIAIFVLLQHTCHGTTSFLMPIVRCKYFSKSWHLRQKVFKKNQTQNKKKTKPHPKPNQTPAVYKKKELNNCIPISINATKK